VSVSQEVPGIGTVMTHHAQQGCTVALPVDLPDTRRLVFLNTEMVADVLDHRAIDVRKDVRTSVVQRIVEVKKPDR